MGSALMLRYGLSVSLSDYSVDNLVGGLSTIGNIQDGHVGVANVASYHDVYSRKVFLGGLPPDIDEPGIKEAFWKFGSFEVYWPGKSHNPNYMFPPKGYAFLQFEAESSVHCLIQGCIHVNDGGLRGLYYLVSSPSVKNKVIQVKPWKIHDAVTVVNHSLFTTVRQFAVFVGGVPRTLTSAELAQQAANVFGSVSYSEIFLDCKMSYPKGSGVIYFSNLKSFIAAITRKYLEVVVGGSVKHVELKPYFNKW